MKGSKSIRAATALAAALVAGTAFAHGDRHASEKAPAGANAVTAEQTAFGIAGDPKRAQRSVEISMHDTMRFAPDALTVKRGETVRFMVSNSGKLLHELVLGRLGDLTKHAELMRKFPGMEHDEPHMVHVDPGKRGEFVWRFNRAGEFNYGCLIPGHFEAGMKGTIKVQ